MVHAQMVLRVRTVSLFLLTAATAVAVVRAPGKVLVITRDTFFETWVQIPALLWGSSPVTD